MLIRGALGGGRTLASRVYITSTLPLSYKRVRDYVSRRAARWDRTTYLHETRKECHGALPMSYSGLVGLDVLANTDLCVFPRSALS